MKTDRARKWIQKFTAENSGYANPASYEWWVSRLAEFGEAEYERGKRDATEGGQA